MFALFVCARLSVLLTDSKTGVALRQGLVVVVVVVVVVCLCGQLWPNGLAAGFVIGRLTF